MAGGPGDPRHKIREGEEFTAEAAEDTEEENKVLRASSL